MRIRTPAASGHSLNVIDESLLYDDFDVERFLKAVENLDIAKSSRGRHGAAFRPNTEFTHGRERHAQGGT